MDDVSGDHQPERRRLTLSRETLRDLEPTSAQTDLIRGGAMTRPQFSCERCVIITTHDYSPTQTMLDDAEALAPGIKVSIEYVFDREQLERESPAESPGV